MKNELIELVKNLNKSWINKDYESWTPSTQKGTSPQKGTIGSPQKGTSSSTQMGTYIRKKENLHKKNPLTPLPDFLDSTLWAEFKKHRKAMRSKMTPQAEKLAINKLQQLHLDGHDTAAIISQSIERGWKGLFPVHENGSRGGQYKTQRQEYEEAIEAIRKGDD